MVFEYLPTKLGYEEACQWAVGISERSVEIWAYKILTFSSWRESILKDPT